VLSRPKESKGVEVRGSFSYWMDGALGLKSRSAGLLRRDAGVGLVCWRLHIKEEAAASIIGAMVEGRESEEYCSADVTYNGDVGSWRSGSS